MSYRSLLFLLISLASCLILTACYEDVVGCLDVNASNYDLDADEGCPNNNCCTYPTINTSVTHFYAGEALRTDTFYQDAAGNLFRLSLLRYYWSELSLETDDGSLLTPVDSVEFGLVPTLGDTITTTLNNNLVLVSSANSDRLAIGEFRTALNVQSLQGRLGLRDAYQTVAPETVASDQALAFQAGRMHFGLDTGFVQLKLEYDLIEGLDTLAKTVNVFGDQALSLDFPFIYSLPSGFDIEVLVNSEVSNLLQDVDLSLSSEVIADLLAANALNMFSVTELSAF